MTKDRLRAAGILAMTSAVLSIPFLLLSYRLNETGQTADNILQAFMQLTGLFLFVFLTDSLKKFLNSHYTFHDADNYIDFLITINLFFTAASIAGLFLPPLKVPLDQFALLLIVFFGGAQILLGVKLLGLPDNLNGMLKPYCFLSILTGILIATVLLIPVAVITGSITDVMLGTIFFQAMGSIGSSPAK